MPPKTRKPTGLVPWPFILVAGEEKSGKSLNAALFSRLRATGQIGAVYWLDLGEGSADEYAVLPGVDYEVLEHNGTFRDILARVMEVYQEAERAAEAGEPPVVLVIDSAGAFWRMLSLWTTSRAVKNRKNQAKLAKDPDAEPDVPPVYWNEANDRHRRVIDLLKGMRGIVIATARLKEVTVMVNGQPSTDKEWKADTQKDLPYDSTVTVHQHRDPRRAVMVGARSIAPGVLGRLPLDLEVPDLVANPDTAGYLGDIVFDILGCSIEASSKGRQYQRLDENLVDRFLADVEVETSEEGLQVIWAMVRQQIPPSADRQRISQAISARLEAIRAKGAEQDDEEPLPNPNEPDDETARIRAAAADDAPPATHGDTGSANAQSDGDRADMKPEDWPDVAEPGKAAPRGEGELGRQAKRMQREVEPDEARQ